MRRFLLIGAMAALFALGMLAGSLLTPAAHADAPKPNEFTAPLPMMGFPGNMIAATENYLFVAAPTPGPDGKQMVITLKIERNSGNTSWMRWDGATYRWYSMQ